MKKLFLFISLLFCLQSFSQNTIWNHPIYTGSLHGTKTLFDVSSTQTRAVWYDSIPSQMIKDSIWTSRNAINKLRDSMFSVLNASIALKLNITDTANIRFRAHAGTNITITGAYPDITINSTGGGGSWGTITGTLSSQTDLQNALNLKAPLASPTFTGVPAAPTATNGTNSTQLASTAFVQNAISGFSGAAFILNNINEYSFTYSGSSTFTLPVIPTRVYWVTVGNTTTPLANSRANFTWSGGTNSVTVTDALVSGDLVYIAVDQGGGFGLTYTANKHFNPYGNFVNNTLDSTFGGTIIGTAGAGYYGFPSQSARPSVPSGLGMREYVDSVGRRTYLGANNLSRSFDAAGQTANRVYRFQDRTYTFADSADVVLKLNISDTANIRARTLTFTPTQNYNAYGNFVNNTLDSVRGGKLLSGGIGFPKATNSILAGTDFISEGFDSASHRYIRYSSNINGGFIRSFDANISANRLLAWPDGNAIDTIATNAFVRANAGGGGGAVSSVSNADGTLTISPTTGAVVASLALGHANTWTGAQALNGTYTASATIDKVTTIAPTITQTSTGGYTGLFISPFENTTGSGAKLLIDAGTNSAASGGGTHTSRFKVTDAGDMTVQSSITITNLGVTAGGVGQFSGGLQTAAAGTSAAVWVSTQTGNTGQTQTIALPTAATTDWIRRYFNANGNAAPAAGVDYTGTIFGPEAVTIAGSGTHNGFFNVAILPNVITTGAGTLTEATTLWIKDAPNLGASKYAFHVNAGASRFGGQMFFDNTNTTTGTTGAQTINKAAGEVNFAAAATTLVVTNSLATTTSNIFVQVYGTDATATSARVTKASGSFTITLNAAATAETKVAFWVIN